MKESNLTHKFVCSLFFVIAVSFTFGAGAAEEKKLYSGGPAFDSDTWVKNANGKSYRYTGLINLRGRSYVFARTGKISPDGSEYVESGFLDDRLGSAIHGEVTLLEEELTYSALLKKIEIHKLNKLPILDIEGTIEFQKPDNTLNDEFSAADLKPSEFTHAIAVIDRAPKGRAKAFVRWLGGKAGPHKDTIVAGGTGVASFYIGLGILAGYQLLMDHPDHPAQWTAYVETLKSPGQYLELIGFMAVFSYVNNRWNLGKQPSLSQKRLMRFSAAMVLGSLTGSAINYLSQADVRKCLGLSNYAAGFVRDMEACDRFYEQTVLDRYGMDLRPMSYSPHTVTSLSEEIATDLMPGLADLLVSVGIYESVLVTLTRGSVMLTSAPELASFLRSIPLLNLPKGHVLSMSVSAAIFLSAMQVSKAVFGIEKWGREIEIGQFNPLGVKDSATISEALPSLLNSWGDLKAHNFNDQGSAKEFQLRLDRYSYLQDKWRAVQQAEIHQSFRQWKSKLDDVVTSEKESHDIYAQLINRIASGQEGFGGFTAEGIEALRKELGPKTSYPVKSMNATWDRVATKDFLDFAIVSMACGPEAEGYTSGDSLSNRIKGIASKANEYVPLFNLAPANMIQGAQGVALRFYPPRLVKRNPGDDSTVCDHNPWNIFFGVLGAQHGAVPDPIVRGREYRNILQYVRNNIRTSILDGENNNFELWWNNVVKVALDEAGKSFHDEYVAMVDKTVKPVLVRADYQFCESVNGVDKHVAGYLEKLHGVSPKGCDAKAISRNPYGLWNSLIEEMEVHLALILDAQVNGPVGLSAHERQQIEQDLLIEAMTYVESSYQLASIISKSDHDHSEGFDETSNRWLVNYRKLKDHLGWLKVHLPQTGYEQEVDMLLNRVEADYWKLKHLADIVTSI